MLDTNVLNDLVDLGVAAGDLPPRHRYYYTPSQEGEIAKTNSDHRRQQLEAGLAKLEAALSPASLKSAPLGVSPFGRAPFGGGSDAFYSRVMAELRKTRSGKKHSSHADALILEVCLVEGWILVTRDGDLARVATTLGLEVLATRAFLHRLGVSASGSL
jgi:predicted nucleic acid-binding protein